MKVDKNSVIELDIGGGGRGKMIGVDDGLMGGKENNGSLVEEGENVVEGEENVEKRKKEWGLNGRFNGSVGFKEVGDKVGDG